MKVEIYGDLRCPWTYLGKRRLEAALADFGGRADVHVEWRPFPLGPEAPADPAAASRAAADEGLTLNLADVPPADTFTAHRLLWWAEQRGGQAELLERLFAAHLAGGADIGDAATLTSLAAEAGLDGAAEFLASDTGVEEVKEAIGEARAIGIESTPTFVFEERWAVSGAQSPEIMRQLLEQVQDQTIGAFAGGGGCCGGDCCGE